MSDAGWTVVDIGTSHIAETQDLFLRVFGHTLSEALWLWKYDAGRGVGVGARSPGGKLLAHYGGTLRKIVVFGHDVLAIQIGDVMVAPEGRAALSHKGPFGIVVQAFLAKHIEIGNGPVFGFGFPNERHMRLGERLKHYVQVDKVFDLSWTLVRSGDAVNVHQTGTYVQPLDWSDPTTSTRLDEIWVRMQHDLCDLVVGSRDFDWWRHRYANHPDHRYLCFWVNSQNLPQILGAIVLRAHVTPEAGGTVWELIDWVSSRDQTKTMLLAAKDVVVRAGGVRLMGWFSSLVRDEFAGTGAEVQEACSAGVTFPRNSVSFPIDSVFAPSKDDLRDKWWLTGGDTDFR